MTIIYILLAFLTAMLIAGILYIVARSDELDEWEERLDKYSVHLDERANRLALWEKLLNERNKDEKRE